MRFAAALAAANMDMAQCVNMNIRRIWMFSSVRTVLNFAQTFGNRLAHALASPGTLYCSDSAHAHTAVFPLLTQQDGVCTAARNLWTTRTNFIRLSRNRSRESESAACGKANELDCRTRICPCRAASGFSVGDCSRTAPPGAAQSARSLELILCLCFEN